MACEGCGEKVDRCRCDGDPGDEETGFGFHVETLYDYEEIEDA